MYGIFNAELRSLNPGLRVGGLTATPYRTGEGPICGPDKMFQKICFEAFTGDLITEGFLCPITNKPPTTGAVNTDSIRIAKGEFVQTSSQEAFNTEDNVEAACQDIVSKTADRHSILTFCTGVEHAENVAECLREKTGQRVEVVTGETFAMTRDLHLQDFADGKLRWLVNCDVLTTGFDAPCIDCIAILRATMSPGLFAQIVGRGCECTRQKVIA